MVKAYFCSRFYHVRVLMICCWYLQKTQNLQPITQNIQRKTQNLKKYTRDGKDI